MNISLNKIGRHRLGVPKLVSMMLSKFPMRTRARITTVDVEKQFDLRLQELGVRPGAEFSVVNRAAFGGLVINIAGARIAVDHRSAKKIMVEHVPGSAVAGASSAGSYALVQDRQSEFA